MSKSRTGRKGRVRLALAAALQDVEAGDTGNDVVDGNNRLGDDSGFKSGDSDKSNAQILNYVQGQLSKPGSANALFTQGEVRGPLLNSVDTQNGASGAITSADGGTYSASTGEADVAEFVLIPGVEPEWLPAPPAPPPPPAMAIATPSIVMTVAPPPPPPPPAYGLGPADPPVPPE